MIRMLTTIFVLIGYLMTPLLAYGQYDSQILMAIKSKHIVPGEVMDVSEVYSSGPLPTQVITFRKIEVIKGKVTDELLRVPLYFSDGERWVTGSNGMYQLAESIFSKGKKLIILFHRKLDSDECKVTALNASNISCYLLGTEAIILYSEDKLKAIKLLVKADSNNGNGSK